MNDLSSTPTGDGPTPIATTLIDDYFDRFGRAARSAGTTISADDVAELRAHVRDRLDATSGTADDATHVLSELGDPESLAEAFAAAADELEDEGSSSTDGSPHAAHLAGRVLGVPFDVRAPSAERYASRSWNPADPHIVVPKALGIGWTINFGALAVRTHLVRPDDEDESFAAVPARAVTATLVYPLAMTAALAALVALTWTGLPAQVPVHWGISGVPDSYVGRATGVLFPAALAAIPLLAAAGVHARRGRPFARVAASAGSLFFATLALATFVQTVLTVRDGTGLWPIWVGLSCALVLPFLMFVSISRIGRAAEQRRDLTAAA